MKIIFAKRVHVCGNGYDVITSSGQSSQALANVMRALCERSRK